MSGAQHIGQLADFLGVLDGLVERLGKVVADQNRQVGVVALDVLEAVAVYHCQVIVVVFLGDKAAGILAEGADLVLPGVGIADQLALIQDIVDGLHDLVAAFDADTDVHGAGLVGDAVLGAELFQPVGTAAAGGNDDLLGMDLPLGTVLPDDDAGAGVAVQQNVLALGGEHHLHTVVGQIMLDVQIQLLGFLGTQVADGAVDQLQTRLDGTLADGLDFGPLIDALHMGVGAKFQVDFIGVVDQALGKFFADQLGQFAADLMGEGQFSVREGSGTGKSGGDGTGRLAVDTVAHFCFGAVALFHRFAFFNQQHAGLAALAQQFQCGEDTGGAGADNDQIVRSLHGSSP